MNWYTTREVDTLSYCRSSAAGRVAPEPEHSIEDNGIFSLGNRLEERYLLKSKLGSGGFGQVFLASDERLDRAVAIKVLYHDRDLAGASQDLETEARIGASLQHPNIAAVYDFGFYRNQSFTVFEYVDGETLRSVLDQRKQIPLEETCTIVGHLARALDHAHSKGIVHRDLKPANVCVTASGLFKVLDLGLARDLKHEVAAGLYSGTPSYSSPEQASCQPTDGRADQYSLGLICYELLTGNRPFHADNPAEMLLQQIRTPAPNPRLHCPALSAAVAAAILRSLEKNPDDRFATCQEFAAAIGDDSLPGVNPVIAVSEADRRSFYICHAPEDSISASALASGLEARQYSCWVCQRDGLPGVSLQQQVRSVIARCHGVLVLISRAFLQTPGLIDELTHAHQMDRVFFSLLLEMSREEFDSQKAVWRSMLGPGALLPLSGRDGLEDIVARLAAGAEAVGIQRQIVGRRAVAATTPHLAGRSWATDANQIDIHDLDRVVFRTEAIDDFLNSKNRTFLSATKGLGKTLLLTYKRHLLTSGEASKQTITLIPEGRPYLDFMSELRSLSARYQKPLSNLNTTKRLWNAALRISVLSHHEGLIGSDEGFELEAFPARIRRWLGGAKVQPTVVFKELTSSPVSELNRLIDDTENFLDQKMRSIHSGTYLFVDKVDQAVRLLPRQCWVNVQAGLIEAAWEMMNANSHIRVFATIREEAFANYESDVKSNLFGATTRLQYSEAELASMLDQLTNCYEGSRDFRDFVGLNVIRHAQRPDPEDSYQFVRRHTFGRPRDLVAMASSMSTKRASLSEDRFRKTVYETSATSLVSNIFDEVQVFLTCLNDRDNRQRFLAAVPQNVLDRNEAIEVCEQFNGLSPGSLQHFGDDSEDIFHPFRDLFLAGLLGVVELDHESGTLMQRFRQPHDILQDIGFELPESDYYLIHPALNSFIAQHRVKNPYYVFHHSLLGHGQVWESYYGLFCEVEKQLKPSLGAEVLKAGRSLLSKTHTQLKSNHQQVRPLFPSDEWDTLQRATPRTDELVYWLEELRAMARQ